MARNEPSSRQPLQEVYAVALGVALAIAVEQVIDLDRSGVPVRPLAVLPFIAFVVTGFALYHWAVRFLDLVTAEDDRRQSTGAIVTSMIVGATEILLLIALSTLISRPFVFLVSFAGLLAFELLAGSSLLASGAYGRLKEFGKKYLIIHAVCLVLAIIGAAISKLGLTSGTGVMMGIVVVAVGLFRTVAFYRSAFPLLFGR